MDASRGAESSQNQETQQALARAGLADTSFGASILANQNMAGRQATAAIPTNIAGQFINSVPQTAGLGIGAAEGAAGASRTLTSTPSGWDIFRQGLQTGLDPGQVFGSKGGSFGQSTSGGIGAFGGGSSFGSGVASNGPLETAVV